MGQRSSKINWSYTEEPHASRRKEILEKYPQIKNYFGIDPSFKYVLVALVLFQTLMAYLLQNSSWTLILIQAYLVGATATHTLLLAVHECAHNLAFGQRALFANKLISFIANLPLGLPLSASFKKFHMEHHRNLGEDAIDTDVPSELEARYFKTTFGKFIWITFQPIFYTSRTFIIYKKSITDMEFLNAAMQLTYNLLILYYFGLKGFGYLFIGFLFGQGLHPMAAHFISEHYMFQKPGQETYSYYGCLNLVTFNVGYHVEHHDFPYVAGRYLPEITKTAPEFYENLEYRMSWVLLIYTFITDPKCDLRCRMKRKLEPEKLFYGIEGPKTSRIFCCLKSVSKNLKFQWLF